MDKNLLAIEIAKLENQVLVYEQSINQCQKKIDSTKFNFISGQVVFVIGMLGLILAFSIWFIWLFLIIIGGLTYLSSNSKRSGAVKEIDDLQSKIIELKKQANDLRAELIAHP